ncbi:hypothetical protein BDU57DRAFT_509302 [Ampelomyces quisqualis]|uniref:Uncharacterized protein n=1 Tax=Ampelomyces quisqualis TaxID=50730 RepID=A0A6A5R133_AMPQU|nr:hypothetical protein BDU57DRAFT_509302 [Ampelomyces quisqualis]
MCGVRAIQQLMAVRTSVLRSDVGNYLGWSDDRRSRFRRFLSAEAWGITALSYTFLLHACGGALMNSGDGKSSMVRMFARGWSQDILPQSLVRVCFRVRIPW